MYVLILLLRVSEMFSSWSHKIGQFEKIDKSLEMLSVVNHLRCKGKNTEVLWTILTTPSMSSYAVVQCARHVLINELVSEVLWGQCMILPHCVCNHQTWSCWRACTSQTWLWISWFFPTTSCIAHGPAKHALSQLTWEDWGWDKFWEGVKTVVPAGWEGSTPGRWRHPAGCWWWWRGRPWCGQPVPPAGVPETTCIPRWRAELWL